MFATHRKTRGTINGTQNTEQPLESRSARLKLQVLRRPYSGPSLARGISLMYRRNNTNGTWVLKASNGHGAYWTKGFALADDYEASWRLCRPLRAPWRAFDLAQSSR
jgi:hypothetical protein